jgi:hypothetical protein
MTFTTSTEIITGTTQEFADKLGVNYLIATGFIKLLREKGIAKETGSRTPPSGKGKPALIYSIPAIITLNLSEEVA